MKIIGIDGGATKVSGAQVIRIDDQTFELIKPIKEIQYKTINPMIQILYP